jgi:hypothetical protein
MRRVFKIIYQSALYIFALTGLGFIGVYVALKFQWTDVPGGIDARSQLFAATAEATQLTAADVQPTLEFVATPNQLSITDLNQRIADAILYQSQLQEVKQAKQTVLCQIQVLSDDAGYDTANIWAAYQATGSSVVLDKMTFSVEPYLSSDYTAASSTCLNPDVNLDETTVAEYVQQHTGGASVYAWQTAEEWPNLAAAVTKDADLINRVATETGVPARLIASALLVEQLRLFHTQREYYEQYFAPLKILASATKFAWGVMSIKENTAKQIEQHLTDPTSSYYLGVDNEHKLDFSTADTATERYNRLTNDDDHYYAYLYGALYLKQLMAQWQAAGYDIQQRPEIILTLFNIGFEHSEPKADPAVGGSTLSIGGHSYTFGGLGYEIYYSGILQSEFALPTE